MTARRLAPGAAAAMVVAIGVSAWPYTVDDAYVVARYADRIAAGAGYTMNDGPPTDGVTGPLWLLPVIAARMAGLAPLGAAKAIGLLCAALAAAWVTARVAGRTGGRWGALGTALLCGLQPTLGVWGVAGLETGLATLLVVAAAMGATARPRPRPGLVGAAVAMLAWLRPETAIIGAGLLVLCTLRDRRSSLVAWGIAAAGLASVLAFRMAMFGEALPLSFQAKPGELREGLAYVGRALVACTGVLGAVAAVAGAWRGRRDDRALALALLAHLAAVVIAGGDWMPGYRLVAPVLPLYALLAGLGAGQLRRGVPRTAADARKRSRLRRILAGGTVGVAVVVLGLDLVAELPSVREAGAARQRAGTALAAYLQRYDTVALVDVGYLAYQSGVEVVDLGGITDPVVAHLPGGHLDKHVDAGLLAAREPDAILLHSATPPEVGAGGELRSLAGYPVERRVARLPWTRQLFAAVAVHRYAPGYYYVVLERRAPVDPLTASRERALPSPAVPCRGRSGAPRPGAGAAAPAAARSSRPRPALPGGAC